LGHLSSQPPYWRGTYGRGTIPQTSPLTLESIPFGIRETLGETIRALAIRAEDKGLELIFRVAPDVPCVVVADPNRLQQILINLIGNAIKFTAWGEVSVSISRLPGDETGALLFEVRDTSIGIAEAQREYIFEAFAQGDGSITRQHGGTGLGLSISLQLVRMMGGTLCVESTPGVGSNFRFTARIGRPDGASQSDVARPDLQGLPVLVVDGSQTNRELLAELLDNWGGRPSLADGIATALRYLERAHAEGHPFRLLFLDARLPESDVGDFVVAAGSHRGLAGEIVAMTGSRELSQKQEFFRSHGITLQLPKPVLTERLAEVLRTALSGHVPAAAPVPLCASLPPVAKTQSLRILVAEDNLTNQKLIQRLLTNWGHQPKIAVNGQVAVDLWERETFDLILMDLEMPVMGGV
jgi:two-component system sensor histidine kinase/response regulator